MSIHIEPVDGETAPDQHGSGEHHTVLLRSLVSLAAVHDNYDRNGYIIAKAAAFGDVLYDFLLPAILPWGPPVHITMPPHDDLLPIKSGLNAERFVFLLKLLFRPYFYIKSCTYIISMITI